MRFDTHMPYRVGTSAHPTRIFYPVQRLRSNRANSEVIDTVRIRLASGPGWLQREVMVML